MLWPYGFVLLAPLLLFAPFLLGRQVLYWGTPLLQFYPWRAVALEAVRSGQWPLWNPYVGNGAPLLANYQSAVLYPPNWLSLLLPLDHSFAWLGALHLALAGAGMVTLARGLGLQPLGQAVAGLAFGLSQYLVARVGFLSINAAVAWLPWIIWAVEHCCGAGVGQRPQERWQWALLLAALVGLLLLAGHAQTAWYILLIAGAWALWRLLSPAASARTRILTAVMLIGAVALGTGLAAAQLLPTAELLRASPRAVAADFEFVVTYSFSPWRLLTALAPDLLGNPARGRFLGYGNYWEDAIYSGVLPVLLAVAAIIASLAAWRRRADRSSSTVPGRNRGLVGLLMLLLAASLLLALGRNTLVFPLFYRYIPTFNLFQAPARMMLGWVFALALLAGVGADRWQSAQPRGWSLYWTRLGTAGSAGVALVALAVPSILKLPGQVGQQLATAAQAVALLGLILFVAGLLSLLRPPSDSRRWSFVVALFLTADLLYAGYGLNPGAPPTLYRRPASTSAALAPALASGRMFQYPQDEQSVMFERLLSFQSFGAASAAGDARAAQLPNTALLDGYSTSNNFDPLVDARYASLLSLAEETHSPALLRLMDVSVLVSGTPVAGLSPIAQAEAAGVGFYALPGETRRAWIVHQAQFAVDGDEALAALARPGFDPDEIVILEGAAAPAVPATNNPARAEPLSLTGSLNAVTIRVTLNQPGWVVVADTYYPGWVASLDGRPAELLRANYAFRAVPVGAGEHALVFEYRPPVFTAGLWLSGLSLLACLAAALWLRRRA